MGKMALGFKLWKRRNLWQFGLCTRGGVENILGGDDEGHRNKEWLQIMPC